MSKPFIPRSYQGSGIDHIVDVPYCALWWSMGLGKSVVTLSAIQELRDRLHARRVLVVAPLRVATMVWPKEAAGWDHLKHLKVQLIRGTPDERRAQIRTPADVHVINYDNLKWLVQDLGGKWPWDVVVADEASKLKDKHTWRWRALKHVQPKIERFIELTGTPAAQGLMGVWPQIYLLDQGRRLFKTDTMFRDRWFLQADRDGRQWAARDGALDEITERLCDIVHCIRAEDYLDLPPLIVNDLFVKLDGEQTQEYRRLEREMYLQLADGEVNSPNAAATSGKCMQYANGAVYLDEDDDVPAGRKRWTEVHDYKLQAAESVVGEAEGENVVIAYQFRSDLARLRKAFPQGEVLTSDPEVEARWNRGEIPVLFVHPRSCGHGLNLQYGGRIVCFFGLTWSLEDYEQVIERIGPTRQLQAGTPRKVFVYRIVCLGTVDELCIERLETNASVQDLFKREMRRVL